MTKNVTPVDEDRKVILYVRNLKQGKTYYARFKMDKAELANNQAYIRESMKTPDIEVAKKRAMKRYAEITVHQDMDIVIKGKTVEVGIKAFIKQYNERLNDKWDGYSIHMLRIYQKHVVKYWIPYIGEKKLSSVKELDFREYEKWRRSYWHNNKPTHGNVTHTPSSRTLQIEVNSMKSVLRWCRDEGYYTGEPISFVQRVGNRNTRSAFSRKQYRRIHTFMRSKKWLVVGKHGTDERIVRHRRMLREYFLFACNIGMRIGEMRQMRWRDVTFDKTESGKKFVRVRVSKRTKVGKSGKGRERIGRYTAFRALQRMTEWRTDNMADDDFVFCKPDGTQVQDFREGFNTMLRLASNWMPKSCGEKIDCEFDTDGVKMTPYCCRHTYITFQLRYRKNPDVYALAENCATSISMIEQYYSDAKSEDFVERLI